MDNLLPWLAGIAFAFFQGVLLLMLNRVLQNTHEIGKHLGLLNNRTGKLETWKDMHEKMAEDREHQTRQTFTNIWQQIDELKKG